MRFVTTILLCVVASLGGCAVSTENFQAESVPMDTVRIHTGLDKLFSYCAGVLDERPLLPPTETAEATPERIYALADALHVQSAGVHEQLGLGCFGENNRGYLELRDCAGLQDPELKNAGQKVLASLNKDRKALYYELALFHHHSDLSVSTIEEIAADTYAAYAKSGEWVQMPSVGPRFERFVKTPLGTRLGDHAVAAGWVAVP